MVDPVYRVLIMAGGTGGHVFPALAVAEELQSRGVHCEWLGTNRGIEARLVPAANIRLHCLSMAGLRGKGLMARLSGVWQASKAVLDSLSLLRSYRPHCVIGLGGYASGPGGLAAWLSRRPLLIHEQNAVPGTTNRILARFARYCFTGYPVALGGRRNRFVGNPVRQEIAALPLPAERFAHRQGPIRVLVLGGSLGALPLNERMTAAADVLTDKISIWHQAGRDHADKVGETYELAGVAARVDAFIEDMAEAYAWADLVICRAGALTCAELTAAGVAALLMPLPHAIDDHQTENARWLADNGAGQILVQHETDAAALAAAIDALLDRQTLLEMAENCRGLAKVGAAVDIADVCQEVMA